jgi:hypothetical protein
MTETINFDLIKRLSHALSSLNKHISWLEKNSNFIKEDRHKYIEQLVREANSFIVELETRSPTDQELCEYYTQAYYKSADRQGPAAQATALRAVLERWGK